jgi:hypothetical protein
MLMKICLSDAARACLGVVLGLSVGAAQGAPINWNYKALLTDTTSVGGDPLGIDGEVLELQITYESTGAWVESGSFLYFGSESASVSITGSHTVELVSSTPAAPKPAAFYIGGPEPASVAQEALNPNILDFIIDGTVTETLGFQGQSSLAPAAGQELLASHLLKTASLPASAGIRAPCTGPGGDFTCSYNLKTIPVLPAAWLFGSGLLGLIGLAWRRAG